MGRSTRMSDGPQGRALRIIAPRKRLRLTRHSNNRRPDRLLRVHYSRHLLEGGVVFRVNRNGCVDLRAKTSALLGRHQIVILQFDVAGWQPANELEGIGRDPFQELELMFLPEGSAWLLRVRQFRQFRKLHLRKAVALAHQNASPAIDARSGKGGHSFRILRPIKPRFVGTLGRLGIIQNYQLNASSPARSALRVHSSSRRPVF